MKKWMCYLLAGVLLLSMTACKKAEKKTAETKQTEPTQNATQPADPPPENTEEAVDYLTKYPVLYQSGEHYAIYMNTDTVVEFYYIVKDQDGNLLDQGVKDYRGSFGFSYRDGLLVMDYGHGGNGGISHRYYDVEAGRVSGFFSALVASNDSLVAYFVWDDAQERMALAVQDIFDESAYFVQISGDYSDCAKPGMPIVGEFFENNTKLKFTYPTGNKDETATKTVTLPGRSENDKMLLQVLWGEKTFTNETGQTVSLQDHKFFGSQDVLVEKYAWVDFDGDGCNELVAYLAPDLGYLVFHLEEGRVYGYDFGYRWMQNLKTDGTHRASGGAVLFSYYSLSFKDGKYRQQELAYRNDVPGTEYIPGKEEYRVAGKTVTAEEFAVFYEAFEKKPDAVWYPFAGSAGNYGLYADFLAGKTTALENGTEHTLGSYLHRMGWSAVSGWQYTFLDMSGDGVPELCVKHQELYIFTIKDGRVCHWYTDHNMYTMPLENGALLMERHGSAPTHINYEYYQLDKDGKETYRITFSWWDGTTVEEGKVYPDKYYVNEQEVTREVYEKEVGWRLDVRKAQVTWYHRSGEIM